jgi:uncharacterized protein YndB with AHSA1/START domain
MSRLTLIAEPGKHDVVMTRVFDAPRDLVFKTYTDPALVPRWWGPEGVTTIIDTMDVRKGGRWRYIQRDGNGNAYAFNGVYHEVVAPQRLIYTFEFEPMAGHVLLETVTFEEQADGTTRLIDAAVFQSVNDRDGMLSSGMEAGAAESMDRLAALLEKDQTGAAAATTARVERFAAQFQAVNDDIIAIVDTCTDEQWRQACVNEGRSVGVVAHHVAVVHRDFTRIIEALAAGATHSPRSSMEDVDRGNARHARAHAAVGQAETLDVLRTNGAALTHLLRGLGDEHLDRVAGVFGGHELTVAQVVEWVVIGHAREHLASIRATIGD